MAPYRREDAAGRLMLPYIIRAAMGSARESQVVRRRDGVTLGYVRHSSAGLGGWAYTFAPATIRPGADYRYPTRFAAVEALWNQTFGLQREPIL